MYLGIDIGGTSFKAGLLDDSFQIVDMATCPADRSPQDYGDYLAREMASLTDTLLSRNNAGDKVSYVGAGIPGFVDPATGQIMFTPNLPLKDVPICSLFQRYSSLPLLIGNDANCAALGEYHAGSGKDASSMLLLTLGTGVGSGFISEGKLYTGWNGAAVEAGHMLLVMDGRPCGCGRKGCFEAYGSATALIHDAQDAMGKDPDSLLWKTAGGSLDGVTGKSVLEAKRLGDATAEAVWRNYLHCLAQGIINAINVFQPELVCIGGGISNAGEEDLLIPLQRSIEGHTMAQGSPKQPRLRKACLGNDAGIIGAALLGLS